MNPIQKDELINEMINKQLSYVGKTIDDVKNDPEWYTNNTITSEQSNEWKKFCMEILRKKFKLSKARAEVEFAYFNLNYGLKTVDSKPDNV